MENEELDKQIEETIEVKNEIKKQGIYLEIIIIVLVFSVVTFGLYFSEQSLNKQEPIQEWTDPEFRKLAICSQITGVPTWIQNNVIINQGLWEFENMSFKVVEEKLIPERIEFFYSNQCGYCHQQIEYFGEEQWKLYQDSGLTIDCLEVRKNAQEILPK